MSVMEALLLPALLLGHLIEAAALAPTPADQCGREPATTYVSKQGAVRV